MPEVKTRIWVDALRWRAESAGAAVYVVRRGDPDAGAVIVKVSMQDGFARLLAPARDFEGERIWTWPLGAEPLQSERADGYIARRAQDDPDLWALEIEDRQGRHFLTEPVENS
ncbi:DUF1491 domain-containing protein [Marinicauda salina]|jgi:hypothetical protein|uniref:DUF1491 domain-containing protein n=1 Tax=Marinicauda salina TaxID=2135793 RepID=A0A2U2BSM3_9PROT|nr:DUF1491 family protein [Marinicauda salina]PWE17014.1 DUF1491 domain-containing protein [Marinicauda salina]